MRITLNGELYELDEPLSVADLLVKLSIDPRRVAVEHNLEILRRPLFAETLVHDGDRIEIGEHALRFQLLESGAGHKCRGADGA